MIDEKTLDNIRHLYDQMQVEVKASDPTDIGAPLGPNGRIASTVIVGSFLELERLARFALHARDFLDAHGERIHDAFVHSGEDHDAWSSRLHATNRIIAEARALGANP